MSEKQLENETEILKTMGYDYKYIDNGTNKTLNLLKNNRIVGHVKSNTNENDLQYFSDYKYDMYIFNVNVDEEHRNKRLCKIIVKLFVLNSNAMANTQLSYLLLNIGKDISCKCYYRAFNECGYDVFAYKYNVKEGELDSVRTPIINVNECSKYDPDLAEEMYMAFVYRGLYGGKNQPCKMKKTRKTNKRKKYNKSKKMLLKNVILKQYI